MFYYILQPDIGNCYDLSCGLRCCLQCVQFATFRIQKGELHCCRSRQQHNEDTRRALAVHHVHDFWHCAQCTMFWIPKGELHCCLHCMHCTLPQILKPQDTKTLSKHGQAGLVAKDGLRWWLRCVHCTKSSTLKHLILIKMLKQHVTKDMLHCCLPCVRSTVGQTLKLQTLVLKLP